MFLDARRAAVWLSVGALLAGPSPVFAQPLGYEAHPSGQPSAVFLSREITDSSVVFENAEHDFPQRVGYRRSESGVAAWIEGTVKGQMRRIDFAYTRVPCAH